MIRDRFLKYVAIDTQSDAKSSTIPSTKKQYDLANLLKEELLSYGLNAFISEYGYVYTVIKKNCEKTNGLKLGFIAHMDTSPDCSGKDVKPRIIKNYQGESIILNDEYQMDPNTYSDLNKVIGDDLIVTDGNTLLGADDKAGVAIIMQLAYELTRPDNKILHDDVYICFTPDEEIGRGADKFDHEFFLADFAYTFDGSEVSGIDYENFNAASINVEFIGKSIHPGNSKNKLINASHLLMEFHNLLPIFLNPAYTEKYEGFNHLSEMNGTVENANAHYIVRNHDKHLYLNQIKDFHKNAAFLNEKYGYNAVNVTDIESYLNMYEVLKNKLEIIELAHKSMKNIGLKPHNEAIRGGTDGARLTFDGLPCPNLGTGGFNFHGRFEFLSINQMQKALLVALELLKELHDINDSTIIKKLKRTF